jgi:hypothetical protein
LAIQEGSIIKLMAFCPELEVLGLTYLLIEATVEVGMRLKG